MSTQIRVDQYIKDLELDPHEGAGDDCFELVINDSLYVEEFKLMNKRGYVFTGEQTDIEFDGEDGKYEGYYNIYYFKKLK